MENLQELKKLKTIALSEENYNKLKQYGFAGESFNDVVGHLLAKMENSN